MWTRPSRCRRADGCLIPTRRTIRLCRRRRRVGIAGEHPHGVRQKQVIPIFIFLRAIVLPKQLQKFELCNRAGRCRHPRCANPIFDSNLPHHPRPVPPIQNRRQRLIAASLFLRCTLTRFLCLPRAPIFPFTEQGDGLILPGIAGAGGVEQADHPANGLHALPRDRSIRDDLCAQRRQENLIVVRRRQISRTNHPENRRAVFLDRIRTAFERDAELPNLLVDPAFAEEITERIGAWRSVVQQAAGWGIPVPALSASLAYFDSYRSPRLPANLLQAQRDYFGAHTYERIDRLRGEFFHTDWISSGGNASSTHYKV